eukprot:14818165-Ditylum_brightwellii.AAC.1
MSRAKISLSRTTLVEMILRRVLLKKIVNKRSLLVQVRRDNKSRTSTTCPEVPVQVCCLLRKATTTVTPSKTERDKRCYFFRRRPR